MRVWLLVIAGWTVIAIVFAISSSLTYVITYQPPQWSRTLAAAFSEWYAWALLTPLVVWIGRRWHLTRERRVRRLVALAAIGLPVAMLKLMITQVLRTTAGITEYVVISNLAAHYFIYWGLVAAVHAVDNYQQGRERELRASRLEASLAAARLQLLTMQLQPHFLFNTLNAISELVHENPPAAERMIDGLSSLLRETLDASLEDVVPLERELRLLARYTDIQKVRFGDRLTVDVTADSDVHQAEVPTLLLQPLVENSIKHGIAATRGAGHIAIRATADGQRLVVQVEDDGRGFPDTGREGVGLANTRARLAQLYGSDFAFEAGPSASGGAIVRIVIPRRPSP